MDTQLAAPTAAAPVDLQHFDAALSHLRRAERDVATMVAYLVEARDALSAAPDDVEAVRRVTMADLRLRGDALALAQDFTVLARPEA